MNGTVDFTHPAALLLLPLALLPLAASRRDMVVFSWLAWLPRDRAGDLLGRAWRALAALAMLAIVLALAGPGRAGTQVLRTGHGAEIVVLFDRSRSMDERMLPADWRTVDPLSLRYQAASRGEPKAKVARELLAKFVADRPDDRFSLIFFSTHPIRVVPFTQHDEVVQAAIAAGGVGRGLADTDVGRALAAAIAEFDQRAYTGSRIVLLVSDGGARLDPATRRNVLAAARRNRVSLNWIYLRSVNSPRLDTPRRCASARLAWGSSSSTRGAARSTCSRRTRARRARASARVPRPGRRCEPAASRPSAAARRRRWWERPGAPTASRR